MQTALLGKTDYMIPELDPNYLNGALGVGEDALKDIGENLAEKGSFLSSSDMFDALLPFSASDRQTIIASYLAFNGDPEIVGRALSRMQSSEPHGAGENRNLRIAYGVLGTVSMAAGAFHGYRRNQSVGWALWWGFMGGVFPVLTPVVALAQGFGKPK